ncbi:MAG: hypothetical protein BWY47_00047 [Bacteroidetes bacterium ADurb.Bin302]|nr:MAG: hypothetical protein BWY47_00047 [Bacteroidetes bacterium ADurb.Bin302]
MHLLEVKHMVINYDSSGNAYGEAADFTSANIPTFNKIIYTEIDTGKIKIKDE